MSCPVSIECGASGTALSLEGELLRLVLDKAFAPGAPMTLALQAGEGDALKLLGKSRGSKRNTDGQFEVTIRLHSLRKESRVRLIEVLK